MSHPLDLHPLHEVSKAAWSAIKKEGQPEFTDLPVDYRSRLLRHAEKAKQGEFQETEGPIAEFERAIAGVEPEPEPQPPMAMAAAVPLEPEVQEELVEEIQEEAAEPIDEPEPPKELIEPKGHLPEDFPAVGKLHDAGINTYTQLSKVDNLTELEGIGPATAKKIEQRVKAERKALNK